jgi:hypothetical protein
MFNGFALVLRIVMVSAPLAFSASAATPVLSRPTVPEPAEQRAPVARVWPSVAPAPLPAPEPADAAQRWDAQMIRPCVRVGQRVTC